MKDWEQYYIGKGTIRQKNTGRWEFRVQYIDIDGVKKKKYFTGPTEAVCYKRAEEFAERLALIHRGISPDVTVVELLQEKLDRDLKLNYTSELGYNRNIKTLDIIKKSFLANQPISMLTEVHLNTFLAGLTDYSDSVISKVYQFLRAAYDAAYSKGIVRHNIMRENYMRCPKSKQTMKKVRGLTESEQKRFVQALELYKMNYGALDTRMQLLISLYSGLRMGEINALRPGDIDFDLGVIHVRRTISVAVDGKPYLKAGTKTLAGQREVPISKTLKPVLEDALKNYKENPEGLIFYDHKRKNVIATTRASALYNTICKSAGIDSSGCHVLRHTFATRCIESGVPAVVLKKWLGHTNIHVTLDTYADVFDRMNFDSIKKFDKLMDSLNDEL